MTAIYRIIAALIGCMHMTILVMNAVAIPFLVYYQPFYIWMPIITVMVSPLLGGTHCMFNKIEDHFRMKAGLSPLVGGDSLTHIIHQLTKKE